MGGELEVTSEVGRGSEFSFTIPLPAEIGSPGRVAPVAALAGRRMLVVDDNETNRHILHGMLAAEAVKVDEVATAADGLAALRRAVAKRAAYDLAILDVQMPDMDGFQLATAVRADKALAGTRLLMLTSTGQRGDGERCRELGIRGYLTKPFKGHELFTLVEQLSEGVAPVSQPVATTSPTAPPVDLEGFRTMLREAGAEEALYSILDTFLRHAPERVATLATAVASGSDVDVAKAAHVFRGAAATIGARELAELLERVETTARAGELERAREFF